MLIGIFKKESHFITKWKHKYPVAISTYSVVRYLLDTILAVALCLVLLVPYVLRGAVISLWEAICSIAWEIKDGSDAIWRTVKWAVEAKRRKGQAQSEKKEGPPSYTLSAETVEEIRKLADEIEGEAVSRQPLDERMAALGNQIMWLLPETQNAEEEEEVGDQVSDT